MHALEVVTLFSAMFWLFFCLLQVNGQSNFYNKKISELGRAEFLHCSNTSEFNATDLDSYQPVAWMLPNLTVLYGSAGNFEFTDGNWTLTIKDVGKEDIGLYNCLLSDPGLTGSSQWKLVRLGLNAGGPYFKSYWEVYKWNTIIGLVSAGVFCVVVAALYALHLFAPNVCLLMDKKAAVGPQNMDEYNGANKTIEITDQRNNAYETENTEFDGDEQKYHNE